MSQLPTIIVDDVTYYFDARLAQLRNVNDPHDFVDLGAVDSAVVARACQAPHPWIAAADLQVWGPYA